MDQRRLCTAGAYALGLLFLANLSWAADGRSGPEWEFTNPELYDSGIEDQVTSGKIERKREQLVRLILKKCGNVCEREDTYNRYGTPMTRVHFGERYDHFYLDINTDPGTVEVQADPLTRKQWAKIAPLIQYLLFDSATELGIAPDANVSAAHIHFSVADHFGDNTLHFMNWVTDFLNHEELSSGILEYDHSNAPPLSAAGQSQIEAYQRLLRETNPARASIEDFAVEMVNHVYNRTAEEDWGPAKKYHDLGMMRVSDRRIPHTKKSVEIRSLRAQRSMSEYLLVIELIDASIEYMKQFNYLVPYQPNNGDLMTDAQKAERFKQYVTRTGLSWDRFKVLMPEFSDLAPVGPEQPRATYDARPVLAEPRITPAPAQAAENSAFSVEATRTAANLGGDEFRSALRGYLWSTMNGEAPNGVSSTTTSVRRLLNDLAPRHEREFKEVLVEFFRKNLEQRQGLNAWRRLYRPDDGSTPDLDRMLAWAAGQPSLSVLRSHAISTIENERWPHLSYYLLALSGVHEERRAIAVRSLENVLRSYPRVRSDAVPLFQRLSSSPYIEVQRLARSSCQRALEPLCPRCGRAHE